MLLFIFIFNHITGIAMSNNTPILVTGAAGNVGSVGRGVVKLLSLIQHTPFGKDHHDNYAVGRERQKNGSGFDHVENVMSIVRPRFNSVGIVLVIVAWVYR
jgi:hypothetical protein